MAYLNPTINFAEVDDGREAELETLEHLRRRLPPSYTVFHSVHWTRGHKPVPIFGEADFVIVNDSGSVLVVEQKLGKLEETSSGLEKRYGGNVKSVAFQIHRTLDGLRKKFQYQTGHTLELDYLLYCPDYRIIDLNAAGLDVERIVDARDGGKLVERICGLLPQGAHRPDSGRVIRFFEQLLYLVPDIHKQLATQERHYVRATGGLAETVSNIAGRPLRLNVRGTAGCGKSMVAVQAYRDAVLLGKRPLLLCFNRPLKEKLKVACGSGGLVETWHGAIDRALGNMGDPLAHGGTIDWHAAANKVFTGKLPEAWQFDTVIVDEGQDFDSDWREMLELDLFGHATTDRIWLDDPDQAIQYGRTAETGDWPQSGWIGYRARCNYRSPKSIARYIKALLPFDFDIANPLLGNDVSVTRVAERDAIAPAVGRIAAKLMEKGYALEDIVVLSLNGLQSSTLSTAAKCGSLTLKRPLGRYDLFGKQQWTEGKLRFDTIRRYKGQQDAAVILTDTDKPVDEARHSEWERLMFTALSRSTDRIEIIAGGATADLLSAI